MKTLITIILTLTMTVPTNYKTLVTKIHEDDQITVLVNYNGKIQEKSLHGYDFNIPIKLSEEIPTMAASGKFQTNFKDIDGKTYYQFISNDNNVWWVLTETEIGFVPKTEKEYILLYCENGTNKYNKTCECVPERIQFCECEVYDDVFLGIFELEE